MQNIFVRKSLCQISCYFSLRPSPHTHFRVRMAKIARWLLPSSGIPSDLVASRKLALAAQLLLREPPASPNQAPDNAEENNDGGQDTKDVRSDALPPTGRLGRVEEGIDVKPLGSDRDVRQAQVQGQDDDEPPEVDEGRGLGARHEDLEEREERVERVLRGVAPGGVGVGEAAGVAVGRRVQDRPVDDGHERWVRRHGGVEERVQGLQGAREAARVQERHAAPRVRRRMHGRDEQVECDAPVCEHGEVRERLLRLEAPDVVGLGSRRGRDGGPGVGGVAARYGDRASVRASPAEVEEERRECVE